MLLYDSKRFKLEKAQKLSPEARKQIAQEDFKYWFKSAREFLTSFEDAFKRRLYNNAAFYLHQATERFYTATLLVFTHYKPKGTRHQDTGQASQQSRPALFARISP